MRLVASVLLALAWAAVIGMPLVGYSTNAEFRQIAPPLLTLAALSLALSGGVFAVTAVVDDVAEECEMQRSQ